MAPTHVFAGIPVTDRDAALDWYERFAGRPPDLIPSRDEAAWQLTETGWIYIMTDGPRAGSASNTLLVDDLDGFLAELTDRSIDAGPIETLGSGTRRAILTDPDGNRLGVGQVPALWVDRINCRVENKLVPTQPSEPKHYRAQSVPCPDRI